MKSKATLFFTLIISTAVLAENRGTVAHSATPLSQRHQAEPSLASIALLPFSPTLEALKKWVPLSMGDAGKALDLKVVVSPNGYPTPDWPPRAPFNMQNCPYESNHGDGIAHMDCDDYSWAYYKWVIANGKAPKGSVWQVSLAGDVKNQFKDARHRVIAIQVTVDDPRKIGFCLIEPQFSEELGCWEQKRENGNPQVPEAITRRALGGELHSAWTVAVWNTDKWSDYTMDNLLSNVGGEKPYTDYPESRKNLEKCGIDPYTCKQR